MNQFLVTFLFSNSRSVKIQITGENTIAQLINKFCSKVNKDKKYFYFLFKGQLLSYDKNKKVKKIIKVHENFPILVRELEPFDENEIIPPLQISNRNVNIKTETLKNENEYLKKQIEELKKKLEEKSMRQAVTSRQLIQPNKSIEPYFTSILHGHSLIYGYRVNHHEQYPGSWSCDVCGKVFQYSEFNYSCQLCTFDLCLDCVKKEKQSPKTFNSVFHGHTLFYGFRIKNHQQYPGNWSCDICKRVFPYNQFYLSCKNCTYDICEECIKNEMKEAKTYQSPSHPNHVLIYGYRVNHHQQYQDFWTCDICMQNFGHNVVNYSCQYCTFDLCLNCKRNGK